MELWIAVLLFFLGAALASFYGGGVAALSAFGRLLEERGREAAPPGLTGFLLRDATSTVTAWVVAGLYLAVGSGIALGHVAVRLGGGALGALVALVLAQLACALCLVLGLLGWKRLAEAAPRPYCSVAAVLVLPFYLALYPVRRPLGAALYRFYPALTLQAGVLFAEDMKDIAEGEEHAHLLDRDEREMITRVFLLGKTVVREIMVPRIDMVAIEESMPIHEIVRVIREEGHSRLPVYRQQVDNIVGFLYSKDLIHHLDRLDELEVRELVRPAYFVPETKRVDELLAEMRSRRIYLAIAVDEYGGTAGLVTMEDIIEEVVGEIHDELDEEQRLVNSLGDGTYRVDAKIDLDDLNELLSVTLPADEYDTLGGLLYGVAGKIPAVGDRFDRYGLEFTIASVRGKRITQVDVRSHLPETVEDPPPNEKS